jgi:hypothetical protein
MTQWRLYINERFTGVTVCPDDRYPSMWRIHAAGQASDITNLDRAKDAALTWARRDGLARRDRIRWRVSKRPVAASLVRQTGRAA